MRRKNKFNPGEFYYIYSRGCGTECLFRSTSDKKRFIKLLFVCNGTRSVVFRDSANEKRLCRIRKGLPLVDIGAYSLLSTHFHLLLHEKARNGISLFMKKLLTAYSMYFNKRYGRNGSLFAGRFHAIRSESDEYLQYVFSYIHMDPLQEINKQYHVPHCFDQHSAMHFLEKYTHSSYLDYIGIEREEKSILSTEVFPSSLSKFSSPAGFIKEWLGFNECQSG